MKNFIIERKLPGAGSMNAKEIKAISEASVNAAGQIARPCKWAMSFVTDDAIYGIHEAETEEVIRKHSAICHFPINKVEEVRMVIGPGTT